MSVDAEVKGYARALFEIARSERVLERVSDELFRLARTLEIEHELRQTLTDISVPFAGKEKLLSDLLGGKAAEQTLNAVRFVISQGHARELVEIAEELSRLAAEASGSGVAEVRTAVPLGPGQKEKLAEALEKVTGRKVVVKDVVDPSIIGGVYARVGDYLIDGTVRGRLEQLKQYLGVQ
ncbi:MAG: ATP synthase F1 subunit delta [Actinomycetota bacterium]